MTEFQIHSQLLADCHCLGRLRTCHLLLHRNAALPWFILVPETPVQDLLDLDPEPRDRIIAECSAVSAYIKAQLGQPKINFAYTYSWEQDDDLRPDGDKTWSASVQVNLPIFSSFGNYTEVKKAKADLRKAQARVREVEQGIYVQATRAALNVKAARTRIGIARKAVEQAEENLRIVQSMYEVGTVSNMDFMDAQLAHTGARITAINALYDVHIAEAELARALGR